MFILLLISTSFSQQLLVTILLFTNNISISIIVYITCIYSIKNTCFNFTYFYTSCALNDQSCRCALKRHTNNNIALTLPLLHAFCLQLYLTACGVTRVDLIKDLTRLVGTERHCDVAEEQFQFVIDQCLDKVDP